MAYIINGERIGDEAIEEEFESIKEHYQNLGQVVCCDRDEEFHRYAQENVVNRTLLEQESVARFGEVEEAAVEARFAELVAEHGDEETFYQNTGFNPGDTASILAKLRSSLTIDRLLDAEIGDASEPADEDLESYYRENIERYLTPEEVRVSQIFVEPTSHEAAREAYLKLREVRRELKNGGDFDAAAREHGSDEDREIDLGFMRQGETMPEIESIVFSMDIGEVSPVIATHYGFHIFKATERKEPEPVPRDQIEGLKEQFLQERRNNAVQTLIERLKAKGTVETVEA